MTCVNCGAPMRLDRAQMLNLCRYCGSRATPPAGAEGVEILGDTQHSCPICEEAKLHDGRIEGRVVHHCSKCRGILIAIGQFLPLIEHLRSLRDRPASHVAPRSDHDANRAIPCPLCRRSMLNYAYGGGGNVHLDSCRACHVIWLDHSELRRIVLAPDPSPGYSRIDILEA